MISIRRTFKLNTKLLRAFCDWGPMGDRGVKETDFVNVNIMRSSYDSELPLEVSRKRIKYRCGMTGLKELDIVLGYWSNLHLDGLNEAELRELTAVLDEESLDLQKWMARKEDIPAHLKTNSVANRIIDFRNAGNVLNYA